MRGALLPFLLLLPALLAGCVEPPEQRWIVQVLGGDGGFVEVPVPVDETGEVPDFAMEIAPVSSYATWEFVESEKGPALRIQTFPNAPRELIMSARQVGAQALSLSLDAGNGTHWMRSDMEDVAVTVVLGHTTPPECPETRLSWTVEDEGWTRVPARTASRCP